MDGLHRGARVPRDATMTRREVLRTSTYGFAAVLLVGTRLPGAGAARKTGAGAARGSGARTGAGGAGRGATSAPPVVARTVTPLGGAAEPRSVCHGRAGTMIVGVGDDGTPVSWRSTDGRRWHARALPSPATCEAEALGVAAHGSRFVAVGSVLQQHETAVVADATAPEGDQQADVTFTGARRLPAVWWTADGASWTSQVIGDAGTTHAELVAVSCHSELLVAVGSVLDADGVQGVGGLVLTSVDGVAWRRGEVLGSELAEGSFTGVALTDAGWFATSCDLDGGVVWASPDGYRWAQVPGSRAAFAGATLQGIGSRGDRVLVAATRIADNTTSYHVSRDGCRTWRTLRPRARTFTRSDATVGDVSVVDGDVVVVGNRDGAPVIEGGVAHVGD